MKNINILVIGSTGKLGIKLLNFCMKHKIKIDTATCYKNHKIIINQKKKFKINNIYTLSNDQYKTKFIKLIKNRKFHIIYFLDYGSDSLYYANLLLENQKNSIFAIANKEMLIAGGNFFINKIYNTNNKLVPLDSEHYSLFNSNFTNKNINKVLITASGGPFYFNKNIDLNNVSKKQVLSHPKWKMGYNNLIDSSNFINKILEIFELSFIYKIDLSKIDFLISKDAFIHSIIIYKDKTLSLNCFENDMLITLSKPLTYFYNIDMKFNYNKLLKNDLFKMHKFTDNRFKIIKKFNIIKKFKHSEVIQFMLINNLAQKLYLSEKIRYSDIVNFIFKRIDFSKKNINLNNCDEILSYINTIKQNLKKNENI